MGDSGVGRANDDRGLLCSPRALAHSPGRGQSLAELVYRGTKRLRLEPSAVPHGVERAPSWNIDHHAPCASRGIVLANLRLENYPHSSLSHKRGSCKATADAPALAATPAAWRAGLPLAPRRIELT
jgi:hypothetical protein